MYRYRPHYGERMTDATQNQKDFFEYKRFETLEEMHTAAEALGLYPDVAYHGVGVLVVRYAPPHEGGVMPPHVTDVRGNRAKTLLVYRAAE